MRRWMLAPVIGLLLVTGIPGPARTQQPETLQVPAPELRGVRQWINSKPLLLTKLHGHVVVIHFWTYGCINCRHNLPFYNRWNEKFAPQGVNIIGIHTPETPAERNISSIRQHIKEHHIMYPIAIDNGAEHWQAWGNRYWPTVYLIDKVGVVRYRWEGELNWNGVNGQAAMAQKISELLAEGR